MDTLRGYWRRKTYVRLDGTGRKRRSRVEVATMGGGTGRRGGRRFWRIRIAPRLRFFRLSTPKQLLIRLRDAYVKMMLKMANSAALTGGGISFYAGDVAGRAGFGRRPLKEYDEKMIVEIYKSLVAQGNLMALDSKPGEVVRP